MMKQKKTAIMKDLMQMLQSLKSLFLVTCSVIPERNLGPSEPVKLQIRT